MPHLRLLEKHDIVRHVQLTGPPGCRYLKMWDGLRVGCVCINIRAHVRACTCMLAHAPTCMHIRVLDIVHHVKCADLADDIDLLVWGTPRKSSAFPEGPMDFLGFPKDFIGFPMKFMGLPRKCVYPIDLIDFPKERSAFLGGGRHGAPPPP